MTQFFVAVEISAKFISDNQKTPIKAVRNNHLVEKKMEISMFFVSLCNDLFGAD